MGPLHFNLGWIEFLANHRTPALTHFFRGVSLVGSPSIYVAILMLMYDVGDKRLAMRLSCVVLFTMSLNNFLKALIANPRPFVREGTYLQKWAVSPSQAKALAAEYSTPSGRAMAAGSFYSYLCFVIGNRWLKSLFMLAIILIGCSRAYLGVHYVEDILIGWSLGFAMGAFGARHSEALSAAWHKCSHVQQISIAVFLSMALYTIAVARDDWRFGGQALGILGYAGVLTGSVIARPLELRFVNFHPRSGSVAAKVVRSVFTLGVIGLILLLFRFLIASLGISLAGLGYFLQYLGYTAAAIAGMLIAPLLFTKMGLAEQAAEKI